MTCLNGRVGWWLYGGFVCKKGILVHSRRKVTSDTMGRDNSSEIK